MTGFTLSLFLYGCVIFYCSQAFHTKCIVDLEDLVENDPRLKADVYDTYNYKKLAKWGAIPNAEEKPWKQIGKQHLKEMLKLKKLNAGKGI